MTKYWPLIIIYLLYFQSVNANGNSLPKIHSSRLPDVMNYNSISENSKTIVFIHGLFVTKNCWDEWIKFYQSKGYTCYAPAYPLKDDSPENLRKNIDKGKIETLRFETILKFYEDTLSNIPGKPILIGHSLGGMLVQLLLQKGYGSAGIAIHSGPPKGLISFKFSFLKSNLGLISPFASKKKPYLMSFKHWQYTFTNRMPLQKQKEAYENYLVPESRSVAKDATGKIAKVNFKKPHVPLLFTAGSIDHIIPSTLNKRNWKKYKDKNSVTDFKEFEGRNHFVIGAENWKEVATYIETWLTQQNLK